MEKEKAIVLFDGYCRLCNGAIHFLAKRDTKSLFQFEPIQSEVGQKILKEINITDEDTVVFIFYNSFYTRSDAFIAMIRLLPTPWNWLRILKYLPKNLRDYIYDIIAANRFSWFGSQKSCSF